ncbi:hypothetical protein HDV00_006666 [Rhizophlyctis rosea]|nr:hypothetical protein HDV00_006666 [Rhizophlyctis rosea]
MVFSSFVAFAILVACSVHATVSGFNDYTKCKAVTTRKEVHDLTTSEWNTFSLALQGAATDYSTRFINRTLLSTAARQRLSSVEAQTPKRRLSLWEEITWLHRELFIPIHNNAGFHPWHRKYISDIEQLLQRKYPSFFWPYWATHFEWAGADWGRDAIWGEGRLGSPQALTSNSDSGCVKGGPSYRNGSLIRFPGFNNACVTRYNLLEDVVSAPNGTYDFFSYSYYDAVYQQTLTGDEDGNIGWALLALAGEAFHSIPHVYVGGETTAANGSVLTGDMGMDISPLDPTFFLHHANVDRIWHQFQTNWNGLNKSASFQFTGHKAPSDPAQNTTFSPNSTLTYFAIHASDAQFISQFCVQYAAPQALSNASKKRRRAGNHLTPRPLRTVPAKEWKQRHRVRTPPDSWFKMHGGSWQAQKQQFKTFVETLSRKVASGGVKRVLDPEVTVGRVSVTE